jgi:hypothetical protein
MLPRKGNSAANKEQRCYHRWMVVLPAGVDMLQALNDIATRGGR